MNLDDPKERTAIFLNCLIDDCPASEGERKKLERYSQGKITDPKLRAFVPRLVKMLAARLPQFIQRKLSELLVRWLVKDDKDEQTSMVDWFDHEFVVILDAVKSIDPEQETSSAIGYYLLVGLTRVFETAYYSYDRRRCAIAAKDGRKNLQKALVLVARHEKFLSPGLHDLVKMYESCLIHNNVEDEMAADKKVLEDMRSILPDDIMEVMDRLQKRLPSQPSIVVNAGIFATDIGDYKNAAGAYLKLSDLVKKHPSMAPHVKRFRDERIVALKWPQIEPEILALE